MDIKSKQLMAYCALFSLISLSGTGCIPHDSNEELDRVSEVIEVRLKTIDPEFALSARKEAQKLISLANMEIEVSGVKIPVFEELVVAGGWNEFQKELKNNNKLQDIDLMMKAQSSVNRYYDKLKQCPHKEERNGIIINSAKCEPLKELGI